MTKAFSVRTVIAPVSSWGRHLIPAAPGILLGTAFPPSPWPHPLSGLIAFAAFAGLIVLVLRCEDFRDAFCTGLFFGLTGYAVIFRGFIPRMGPIGLLALAYTALLVGVWASVLYIAPHRVRFLAAPFLWVALEATRGYLLGGTYWGHLALTQIESGWARGLVGMLSREAVAFVVVGAGAAAAALVLRRYIQGVALLLVCTAAVVFVTPYVPSGRPTRIAAVQTWYDNFTKWMPMNLTRILQDLTTLTNQVPSGTALVVWPETAVPADPFAREDVKNYLIRSSKKAQLLAGVLVGPPMLGPAGRLFRGPVSTLRPVNTLLLVDRSGDLLGAYAKATAFPYGEMGLMTGPGFRPLDTTAGRTGAFICWENSMPGPALEYSQKGAVLVAVAANLAWFGPTIDAQYLAHSKLLAAEMRVPVVQAVNGGSSAIIGADGSVRGIGPLHRPGVASSEVRVPELPGRAPFWGLILRITSLGIAAICAVYAILRQKQDVPPPGWERPAPAASVIASLSTVGAVAVLFGAGYFVAGFPIGRPSPTLAGLLLVSALVLGYLAFKVAWKRVHVRYGEGAAAIGALLILWIAAITLLPVEAAGWIMFVLIPLVFIRRRYGDPWGPVAALVVAAVLSPVWVALP